MTDTDAYERWMQGSAEHIHSALFEETIASIDLDAPRWVAPTASIAEVIGLMNQHRVGCVLVVEDNGLVGIFTERDLLTRVVTTAGLDFEQHAIGEFMTRNPETLRKEDRVVHALQIMAVGGYRHVPILEEGRPVGVFGMRTCMRFIVDLYPNEILNAPPPEMAFSSSREGA
jgi:signal-transduction protein with cAMP-binding, CBS, and nucleotidyltransferase domain